MTDKFIQVAKPNVGEEEAAAVREVLLSGNYVSGAKVEEFERRFAEYIGVKYAIAVNSGTTALHTALEAMGIGKGDEVIVPPLTFFATISAVLYLRAVPIFADIDLDDLCLSPSSVEERITTRTKAIIPVHLFGAAAKLNDFLFLSERYNLCILEDCAQAHGTAYKGTKVGAIGKAGAFSFFATKHMTTGEGGVITTNDNSIAKTASIIRNHGMVGRDQHAVLGYNNRMTEIEAAMGLVQLSKLDKLNAKRIKNSQYLIAELLKLKWTKVPGLSKENTHTYFWCPLMIDENKTDKNLDELKLYLKSNHIGFRHRYNEPLYKQPVLKKYDSGYSKIFLPNVENVSGKIIGLPNHPDLKKDDLDRIIKVLQNF
jgi:dTDP-4-amino-4,6-dideoxygalactose transaminase